MPEQIILYTSKLCPFAHRVELALAEAKVDYIRLEIDLKNKPEWYASKVNPAGAVPAIAYGGPKVPAGPPSPESAKIAESLVLVEFVADLYPEAGILPKDPLLRAKARFFIDTVSTKVVPAFMKSMITGQSFEPLWDSFQALQDLLSADKPYALGDVYSAADMTIAPFLARLEVFLKNDIGAYKVGEGPKAAEYFFSGVRFKRLVKYFEDVIARETFKVTFDEEYNKAIFPERFAPLREKAQAAATATAV
ncbi:hypothetical protein C8R44DRAFT_321127 [Mycena epipterygia]|nr:hypothetical protein C8R44DRAFT_321127 [Mycena epipterygia]